MYKIDGKKIKSVEVLVKLEEEYEHSRQWKRRMKSFSRVILSLIAQNEFRGRQKK